MGSAGSPLADAFEDPSEVGQRVIVNRMTIAAINAKDWRLAWVMVMSADGEHAGQPLTADGPQPGNTAAHALAFQRVPAGTDVPHYAELVARVVALVKEAGTMNHQNEKGLTALAQACAQGNVAVAEALLQAGADPNVRCIKQNQIRYAKDFAEDGMCERRLRALFVAARARSAGDDVAGGPRVGSTVGSFQQRQGFTGKVRNNPRRQSPFPLVWPSIYS